MRDVCHIQSSLICIHRLCPHVHGSPKPVHLSGANCISIYFQGLNDLYDFKRQHPDADLNPFLKKSTQFFQDYIERGLKSVELERQEKQKTMTVSGLCLCDGYRLCAVVFR